jgi:hypothetical protein|tara:strand:+ start:1322 stop:1603 length:282 start_codon:yes stop_codon:yes gene_type:complete
MTSYTETILELESFLDRYQKALEEIASSSNQANPIKLKEIARVALDGEPTTADKFNEIQDYGPPYSMANPTGEPIKDSPLGAGFAHKDIKNKK